MFFLCEYLYASECQKVDNFLSLADNFVDRDYDKTFYYSMQAIAFTSNCGDPEKKAWSYYYAAKALIWKKKLDESLNFADKALEEDIVYKNPILLSCLKNIKVSVYSRLGTNNLALQECYEILEILHGLNTVEAELLRARAYYGIAIHIDNTRLSDSYFQKSNEILKHISDQQVLLVKRIFRFKAYFYHARAGIFLSRKKMDSAKYYSEMAYRQSFIDDVTPKNHFLGSIGNYYYENKDDKKALFYYMKAMDEIDKNDKDAFLKNGPNLLKKIYQIYHRNGDTKNEKIYLDKYYKAQNDFGNHVNEHVLKTTNRVLDGKVNEYSKKKSIYKIVIIIITIFCLVIVYFLLRFYNKKKAKQDIVIAESQKMLFLKEKETILLKSMVDEDALNDIIKAAKMNVPEFWGLFQKSHPGFIDALTKINPDLKTTELILCAYIFLGFNTKDIAEYTFKAIQTVKNNKHNLRRRLQLPPKQDMTVWIRTIYKEKFPDID